MPRLAIAPIQESSLRLWLGVSWNLYASDYTSNGKIIRLEIQSGAAIFRVYTEQAGWRETCPPRYRVTAIRNLLYRKESINYIASLWKSAGREGGPKFKFKEEKLTKRRT